MYCMYCGQELPDGARFCMKCGTPQGSVSPVGTTADDVAPDQEVITPSPFKPLRPVDFDAESYQDMENINPFVPLGSANSGITSAQVIPNSSPFVPASQTNTVINNVSFVPAMCPNCNAHMQVNISNRIARCHSCGTECLVQEAIQALNVTGSVNVVHSGVVVQKHERPGEPNIHISYTSTVPSITMSLDINPGIKKVIFLNGSTQSFTLAPGIYVVSGKIGSLLEKVHDSFTRRIEISDAHPSVTITVGVKPGFLQSVYVNVC